MKNAILKLSIISCCLSLCLAACNYDKKGSSEMIKSDKFVDIGTHSLRVVLSDIPSKYTIILEAGGGKYSESYNSIQDTLAKSTGCRVISYDRSGFGQSELGPDNFNAIDEVNALKKCLDLQGFDNNYILVGLSWGGLMNQLFTQQYPELVKGLVLIDPFNVKFVDGFGLDKINAATPYFENPTENYEKAGNRQVDNAPIAFDKLRGYELPESIPVTIITSGNPPFGSDIWRKCHEEIVMNSENHKLIIAEGINHDILMENPELVLNTIIELTNNTKKE